MIKKILFIFLMLFSVTGLSYGDEPYAVLPCEGNGEIVIESITYNPMDGNFMISFTFDECVTENGAVVNGTIDSSGTFVPMTETTASVNISTTVDVTSTIDGATLSVNCTGNSTGTYNLQTEILNGNNSLNCSSSGTISIDPVNLFLGPITHFS